MATQVPHCCLSLQFILSKWSHCSSLANVFFLDCVVMEYHNSLCVDCLRRARAAILLDCSASHAIYNNVIGFFLCSFIRRALLMFTLFSSLRDIQAGRIPTNLLLYFEEALKFILQSKTILTTNLPMTISSFPSTSKHLPPSVTTFILLTKLDCTKTASSYQSHFYQNSPSQYFKLLSQAILRCQLILPSSSEEQLSWPTLPPSIPLPNRSLFS